jgi:hypothetical protein
MQRKPPPATIHATYRIAQRGICPNALDLVCTYGIDLPAGSGCVRREVRRYQLSTLLAEGHALRVVERALRIEAICSEGGLLITCYLRAPRPIARRFRHVRHTARAAGRTWRA